MAVGTVLLMVLSALPGPASAYPGSVDTFEDGTSGSFANLTYPPESTFAGRFTILSNATVTSARVGLTGAPFDIDAGFADDYFTGFPDGTPDAGVSLALPGLSLRLLDGSTEFSGSAMAFGLFSGTAYAAETVVLTGATGTYETPLIASNGISFGRLVANFRAPAGSSIIFSVVDAGGSLLQANLAPGALITVNAATVSDIRIRASLTAPTVNESPVILNLGSGFVMSSNFMSAETAPGLLIDRLQPTGVGLQLRESFLNWTEFSGNPVIVPASGTWHHNGILTGSAVNVGTDIWMYVSGIDSSGRMHIGRMVSGNGGQTWIIDAQPLLNSTASTWDRGYLGIPSVIREANGTFAMWYMGAVTVDQFDIGFATSADGITWTKHASNPVLTQSSSGWDNYNVGWPVVVKVGSTYSLFFGGRTTTDARKNIGYATSSDGFSWTKYTGNPVIDRSAISAGSYDMVAAHVVFDNGLYYMYWTCGSGANDMDTCVSYSTDKITWTHPNNNPIITNGDGNWDSITAELATRYTEPLTGNAHILFSGRPNTGYYSQGRADPHRASSGSLTQYWDLAGEVPHALLSHSVAGTNPPATSLQASVATSSVNGSYFSTESVANPDSSILLAPKRWLRYSLALGTASPAATPTVEGARLDYDRYVNAGTFTSAPLAQPYPIANATLVLDNTVPSGTTLQLSVSNDDGSTWIPATSGGRVDFPSPGTVFRYRLALAGTSDASPIVRSVTGDLGVDSAPNDIVLRGADGSTMGQVAGELVGATTVTLDPAYFNDRIAPFSGDLPYIPVPFELWVDASSAGSVRIDFLDVQLTFPDLLRVYFAPDSDAVLVEEGESLALRAVASTTPGLPITFAWEVDGSASSVTADRLRFDALAGSIGNHTVNVSVTNGQFWENHSWAVRVVPKPVFWVAKYFPAVIEVEVPVTLEQFFYVAIANASGIQMTVTWTLDGAPVGSDPIFVYTAPDTPGVHTLSVDVSGGDESGGWTWTVEVTAEPGTVLHMLEVDFSPAGDVELAVGQSEAFGAALAGTAPTDVAWDWRLDGELLGAAGDSFSYEASTPGRFVVSVVAFNATALSAHSWVVTVLPPPLPAPPSVTFTQPVDDATVTSASLRVDGTATPGAGLTVNGAVVDQSSGGVFTANVILQPGSNMITATVRDSIGQTTSATLNVTYDAPPVGTDSPVELTGSLPFLALVVIMAGAAALFGLLWFRELNRRRTRELIESEPLPPREER